MTKLQRLKYLFAVLYFVQGGVLTYFSLFQKPYLNKIGIDRRDIALLTSILLMPFVLKIFFGKLSDLYGHPKWGHRKPFMLLGQVLASLCFLVLTFFTAERSFMIYSLLVLTASFCVAMFDAATDGLAIDIIPDDQQGPVQSYMVGGKALGAIVLSLGIGQIVSLSGQAMVFLVLSLSFLFPLYLTWNLKTSANDHYHSATEDITNPDPKKLKDTPLLILIPFAITYSIVSFGSDGLITLFLSDKLDVPDQSIGVYGSMRGLGAVVGALLWGETLKKSVALKMHFIPLCLLPVGSLLLAFVLSGTNFKLIGFLWGAIWSMQEVSFLTLAMKSLNKTFSAFGFALVMALANLGTALGDGMATALTKHLEYYQVFLILGLMIIFPLMIFQQLRKILNAEA